ncbi:MAG: 30S ribosomal protein S20 [Candidatus Rhabdochlamydia sp.]
MAEAKKGAAKKKISSAQKREKQNEKRRLENRSFKSTVRTAIRSYETALAKQDQAQSETALNHVYSLMDKGVKTGRFTTRKAARTKSRLTTRLATQ